MGDPGDSTIQYVLGDDGRRPHIRFHCPTHRRYRAEAVQLGGTFILAVRGRLWKRSGLQSDQLHQGVGGWPLTALPKISASNASKRCPACQEECVKCRFFLAVLLGLQSHFDSAIRRGSDVPCISLHVMMDGFHMEFWLAWLQHS